MPRILYAWAVKYRVFSLVLCAFAQPVGAFAQGAVFRGPMLNDVTSDAITIIWESPTPTTGVIRYGLMSPSENTVSDMTPSTYHAVRLTGLAQLGPPGSEFVYELDVSGTTRPGRFFTAVTGQTPYSFIAYGDNRSSRPQHEAVVAALLAEQVRTNLAISTGDMVSDGENEAHWDDFFDIEAPFLANMPVYLAIGNHEVDGGDWDIGRRLFQHPQTVPPASNSEAYFHFVYGNVEFIVINAETDTLYTIELLAGDQEAWLQDVLDNPPPSVDHRLLFIHKGPYSSKQGRTGNFWLRQWLGRLKTGGVSVIFSGHDHYAERGFTKNGMYYVIHGGGGAPLYDTLGPRTTADHTIMYGETRLGYVLINVDGPKLEVVIKGLAGEVVDSFVYGDTLSPGCQTAADCGAAPPNGCLGGEWACERNACTYSCGDDGGLIACLTDNACEDMIGSWCMGDAICERPGVNPLDWYCQCDVPPECVADPDCTGRAPPVKGCEGTWACEMNACEFLPKTVCTEPMPSDAGLPDASPQDAGQNAEDAGSVMPSMDAGVAPKDAGLSAPDSGQTDAGQADQDEPEQGCDCSTQTKAPKNSLGWPLLVLGIAFFARRRAR